VPQAQESCPAQRKIWSAACHRDSKSANLSPSVCSPTEEAGKNVQIGFFGVLCGMPQAFYRDLQPATIVIVGGQRMKFLFIQYSKCECFKNRSFLRDDKKILKYGSGSYWMPKACPKMGAATKRRKTKLRWDKTSTHQKVDYNYNKTSTTTKRRKLFFLLTAIYKLKYLTTQDITRPVLLSQCGYLKVRIFMKILIYIFVKFWFNSNLNRLIFQ
jgi:hypothetical protein